MTQDLTAEIALLRKHIHAVAEDDEYDGAKERLLGYQLQVLAQLTKVHHALAAQEDDDQLPNLAELVRQRMTKRPTPAK